MWPLPYMKNFLVRVFIMQISLKWTSSVFRTNNKTVASSIYNVKTERNLLSVGFCWYCYAFFSLTILAHLCMLYTCNLAKLKLFCYSFFSIILIDLFSEVTVTCYWTFPALYSILYELYELVLFSLDFYTNKNKSIYVIFHD